MTVLLAVLLITNAVFTAIVWPTFYKRVARDPRARDASGNPTRFLTVHRVIVGVAFLIAAVSLMAALVSFVAR
ncbi:MAG: hypothetical protein QOI70_1539 [Microbacteriaceae bacterium]|nr:hypothetical protein [Microbacteriaceae bacterium]